MTTWNFSPGAQGVWGQELKAALYDMAAKDRPLIYNFIAGLGGRDISIKTFEEVLEKTLSSETPDDRDMWLGVQYAQPESTI